MGWHVVSGEQEILKVIEHLISTEKSIRIRMEKGETAYNTKCVRINEATVRPGTGKKRELIVERLIPRKGNKLIQDSLALTAEFLINENFCRCTLENRGMSRSESYPGWVLSFPKAVEIENKRRDPRFTFSMPEFVSVEFQLKKGGKTDRTFELNVLDCSRRGLGVLVIEKDFDLLEAVEKGDEIKDIVFYATTAMIKVDGTVRHKTKINEGKHKGCYLLGIESSEIILNCELVDGSWE